MKGSDFCTKTQATNLVRCRHSRDLHPRSKLRREIQLTEGTFVLNTFHKPDMEEHPPFPKEARPWRGLPNAVTGGKG